MKNVTIMRVMAVVVGLLLTASMAEALPVLQLYLEGATYDTSSETWVVGGGTTGGTARLWVIGDVGAVGSILDMHLAAAYDAAYDPLISLTPASIMDPRLGFSDPSVAGAATYVGTFTGVPVRNDGKPLQPHGIYGDGTEWQRFDLGNMTLTDSQMANFSSAFPTSFANSMGQINVYDLAVSGDGLPDNFTVHFDVYNHVEGDTRSIFAPFSHDAEIQPNDPPPVPEPASLIILGCVGAGMLVARKIKRSR